MTEQQEEKFFGTPEEIAEEIMQAGQFGGSLEACTELIKMYALQFKSDSVGDEPSEDTIWAEIINEARHYNGSPHDLRNITEHFKKFYSVHLLDKKK